MTYIQARAIFRTARFPSCGKPLSRNTRLVRAVGGDAYCVRLYGTNVVTIHADGTYTLRSGSWRTDTTRARIRDYSPASVHTADRRWMVGGTPFFDGVRVDANGAVVPPDPGATGVVPEQVVMQRRCRRRRLRTPVLVQFGPED